MPLRFFTDARCLEHQVPEGFPELPDRLRSLLAALEQMGMEVADLGDHPATEGAIQGVHEAAYIERFETAVGNGDPFLDTGDNPLSPDTWRAARSAVDACLHATDWALGERDRRAIALVRPPGHHAERSMAMGFCYFNNVAVVAQYLIATKGVDSVAIVDFDVHHGNGTQHIFEERSDVLYASLHQHPFYPGTGAKDECGRGDGEGATLNAPLPAGSDDRDYRRSFEERVLPGLRAFRPEFLLISAGFDASFSDPVGGMRVTLDGFQEWGRWLAGIAAEHCRGRLVVTLEGGYDISGLPEQLLACCRGLQEA